MTLFEVVRTLHIVVGFSGLVLGPVAMVASKRPGIHTRAGEAYHRVMLAVCISAGLLAVLDWGRLWWFLLIAAGSYAFALVGYVAAKRRWPGWIAAHISGQGGSYIAMTTAVLVVNWRTLTGTAGRSFPIPWILPTLVGTSILAWVNSQVRLGRRPKLP